MTADAVPAPTHASPAVGEVRFGRWKPRGLLPWVLLAGLALSVGVEWWPGHVERTFAPADIRALDGHSYVVEPLALSERWLFSVRFDSSTTPTNSGLILLEDGRPFGTPHSQHAEIAKDGRGGYSHWGNSLYFSTHDNSDPRTNGRRYGVQAPLAPGRKLLLVVVTPMLLAGLLFVRALGWFGAMRAAGAVTGSALRRGELAGVRPAILAGAVLILAYLGYFALIDPLDAIESARRTTVSLAFQAMLVATGAVVAAWPRRQNRTSWRPPLAIVTLLATAWLLYLRVDGYRGDYMLPSAASIAGPMIVGVLLMSLVRSSAASAWGVALLNGTSPTRRDLAVAVGLVLCLAAPMIWSPVIANWNASGWMDSHGYDTYAHNILSGKKPEGSSEYMPVYQYGMAAVYYLFGHFFFAQQLTNVALSFMTVALICLAAWNLFRNIWAVLLIGTWAAFMRQLFYAVFFTQIESWYIPIVAFGIFAWTCYWRTPSRAHLLLLVLAAGLGVNTRTQGLFYFAWLCLAPLFIASLPWRRRLVHTAAAVVLLAASLVPWSIRNYVVDGRLSPSAARNAYYLAVLNDPRIGLYGVRYWEGWGEITADYDRRYPDPVERDRVMTRAGLSVPFTDFAWFQRAMMWRSLAFYGLLPTGVFEPAGPRPTDWATEWSGYVYWRTTPLLLIPLSLIGLVTRPGRATLFLAGGIAANVAVVAIAGGAEDRVSYPVLPLHMLLGLAAVFPPRSQDAGAPASHLLTGALTRRRWVALAACAFAALVVARLQFGQPNLYAPLVERAVLIDPNVHVDETLPSLNDYAATAVPAPAPDAAWDGRRVRLRLMALNYQSPPKYGGRIGYMPEFSTDPGRETYYFATLLVRRDGAIEHLRIGVAWFGATMNERLREGDEVEAEGRLLLAPGMPVPTYWVRIEKARKAAVRSTDIPAFF